MLEFKKILKNKQLPIRETMTEEEFQTMMNTGMQQVNNNESQDMDFVFNELMKGL